MAGSSVLIVDDDQDIVSMMEIILSGEGYRVRVAPTGKAGLDETRREMPSLILLDMKMPVMDGWEFVRCLREEYAAKVPPVVIVSAAEDAKSWAQQVGAAGWLAKPFDIDDLLRTVGKYVGKS
ncbi:MAG: response regulator [Chloroflexi bacterium]|nr:response regulator [Chloroflexota bacterium]